MNKEHNAVGSKWLEQLGVPQQNITIFCNYLNSYFEKRIALQVVKKFVKPNPTITLNELKVKAESYIGFRLRPCLALFLDEACPTKTMKEKLWVQKIYKEGLSREDVKNILLQYNRLDSKDALTSFSSLEELQEYILNHNNVKPIDVLHWDDETIEMFLVTNQEEMDFLGRGTNWCTLNGHTVLDPFKYYLFRINGKPQVLFHPHTQEMKDASDGPIYDGWLAKMIYPLLKEHNLIKREPSEDVYKYLETMRYALKISNLDDADLEAELANDLVSYNFLGKEKKIKFAHFVLHQFTNERYALKDFNKLSYGSLSLLANHLDEDLLTKFEDFAIQKVKMTKKEGVSDIKRLLPKELRTRRFNSLIRGVG